MIVELSRVRFLSVHSQCEGINCGVMSRIRINYNLYLLPSIPDPARGGRQKVTDND